MDQQPQEKSTTSTTVSNSAQREKVALTAGKGGILGVKAGMTQVYGEKGESLAVTVIDLKPTVITQIKSKAKEGYQAVQVGFLEKPARVTNKPDQGHVKASGATGFYY